MTVERPQLPRWIRPRACCYVPGETAPTPQPASFQQTEPPQADRPACRVGKRKRRFEYQPYRCDLQMCVTTPRTHKGCRSQIVRAVQLSWTHATRTAAVTGLANLG